MGPFYCPTDKQIYIDPSFFNELSQRFGAPGDFAQAYVIAHEVGHHVQDLEGTLDQAHNLAGAGERDRGQCDPGQGRAPGRLLCRRVGGQRARCPGLDLEPGDVEEGMRAAEAIGDDTLQKQSQGVVVPDSFTHGTSAQRMEALQRGFKSGNPAACKFALEPDQHLPGVGAAEQAEEGVGHRLEPVDDRLAAT